jgi:hypothetical protein
MSNDPETLIFQSDPKRFMDLVMTDDAKTRLDGFTLLNDIALCEIVRYGVYSDENMISDLSQFYREIIMEREEEQRFELYQHVAGLVENVPFVSANAFLPFIAEDTARRIVSTAVIDYVSSGQLTDNDPMSRPKDIIGMIESSFLENEGAAFGALLYLGDERVCRLLWPIRDSLDNAAINEAVNCSTGFMYSATADFYMDWLEGMEGDLEDGLFGIVASGLYLLKKSSQQDLVFTGQRPFPAKDASPEEFQAMRTSISIGKYLEGAAPRFFALERTEPPPRVMPHVLLEWGLDPVTDPSEMEVFDDRTRSPVTNPAVHSPIPEGETIEVEGDWFDGTGNIFLLWGILNPNGPTLYCLGDREVNGKQRIFFRWLHMLGGRTTYAANSTDESTYQDIFDGAVGIQNDLISKYSHGIFKTIPSFIIATGGDETLIDIAQNLITNGPVAKEDWGKERSYLDTFRTDFFARAGSEIRGVYDEEIAKLAAVGKEPTEFLQLTKARYGLIDAFENATFPEFESSELTPKLLEEWSSAMCVPDLQNSALDTLATMWNGAISMLPEEMKAETVPFDRVIDFLDNYHFGLAD